MNDDTDPTGRAALAAKLRSLTTVSPTRSFLIWLLSDKRRVRKFVTGFVGVCIGLSILPGVVHAAVWRLTYDPAEHAATAADTAAVTADAEATPTFGGLWPTKDTDEVEDQEEPVAGPDRGMVRPPSSLGPVTYGQSPDPTTAEPTVEPTTAEPTTAPAEPSQDTPAPTTAPAELTDAVKQQITGTAEMFVSVMHDKAVTDYQAAAYFDAMATPTGIDAAAKVDRASLPSTQPDSSKITASTPTTATVTVALDNGGTVTVDLSSASEGFWLVDAFTMGG